MPAKKTGKEKPVSKEMKEVKDQSILVKSDPKRERKTPARFSIAVPKTVTRELVIPKGSGVALSSIPSIANEISKRKMEDPALMTLHHLAFGMAAKRVRVKSNLRQFSGVKYDSKLNRAKLEQRIQARSYAVLRSVCALLQLSSGGSTADIVGRIADFLERPTLSEKDAKAVKKAAAPKKDAPKKAAPKKAAPKKAAEKKPAEKKAAEKKPAKKAPAKKPVEKKAPAKKPAAKKAKTEEKPKAAPKKAAPKKPAAKKTTKK